VRGEFYVDAHDRVRTVTGACNGSSTNLYNAADQIITVGTPAGSTRRWPARCASVRLQATAWPRRIRLAFAAGQRAGPAAPTPAKPTARLKPAVAVLRTVVLVRTGRGSDRVVVAPGQRRRCAPVAPAYQAAAKWELQSADTIY